jgi:NADH-ubiquinone oxidoreductase chain 2
MKEGFNLFNSLFHNSNVTMAFHSFAMFVSIIMIQLTAFFPRKYQGSSKVITMKPSSQRESRIIRAQLLDKAREQYTIIEYPLISLFIILGTILLMSSSDVVSMFLSIELQSYGLYLLCALYRNSESSTGAGLTYFLLGGLSSCFILLASGILYTNSGTTSLNAYYMLINIDTNSTADILAH